MDWDTIIRQQDALEKSFGALKQVFETVEAEYREKRKQIMQRMAESQSREAVALGQIHNALSAIIESNKAALGNIVEHKQ